MSGLSRVCDRGWLVLSLVLWLVMSLGAPALVWGAAGGDRLLGRVDRVVDGDTLTVIAGDARHRIRLYEIDAPEHDQPGSVPARQALASKIAGKFVRVQVETTDDYGRLVGKVWLGDRDINRELVQEGHAWAFRRYLQDPTLLEDEAAARRAGRGVWALTDPVAPWEWRQRARRAAGSSAAEAGCVIKGNINTRGDRIYHRPGDRHYAQTRISSARGERWFCTVAEAEQAGWRAPR